MIVAPLNGGHWEIVTQNDHARFAAELSALWVRDGLPDHPRRDDLLFAVREHDNGWREKDAAPLLDSAHRDRPHDFRSLPPELRSELWRTGCLRYEKTHPYASLLIVEHAIHLHGESDQPCYVELATWLEELRLELLDAIDVKAEEIDRDARFLRFVDLVSLTACGRWHDETHLEGLWFALRGDHIRIDPMPLVGRTTFRIPVRVIPRRPYRNATELLVELASASWKQREVSVGS